MNILTFKKPLIYETSKNVNQWEDDFQQNNIKGYNEGFYIEIDENKDSLPSEIYITHLSPSLKV